MRAESGAEGRKGAEERAESKKEASAGGREAGVGRHRKARQSGEQKDRRAKTGKTIQTVRMLGLVRGILRVGGDQHLESWGRSISSGNLTF